MPLNEEWDWPWSDHADDAPAFDELRLVTEASPCRVCGAISRCASEGVHWDACRYVGAARTLGSPWLHQRPIVKESEALKRGDVDS
jgi:hypothetical protein